MSDVQKDVDGRNRNAEAVRLVDIVRTREQRFVAPLMGLPGVQLTHSTVRQNQLNSEIQVQTIKALVDRFRPDAVFCMMDLSVEASALGLPVSLPEHETPTITNHPVTSIEGLWRFRGADPMRHPRVGT
jgi:uroporphyrinogen decarboxylase